MPGGAEKAIVLRLTVLPRLDSKIKVTVCWKNLFVIMVQSLSVPLSPSLQRQTYYTAEYIVLCVKTTYTTKTWSRLPKRSRGKPGNCKVHRFCARELNAALFRKTRPLSHFFVFLLLYPQALGRNTRRGSRPRGSQSYYDTIQSGGKSLRTVPQVGNRLSCSVCRVCVCRLWRRLCLYMCQQCRCAWDHTHLSVILEVSRTVAAPQMRGRTRCSLCDDAHHSGPQFVSVSLHKLFSQCSVLSVVCCVVFSPLPSFL